jgi:molybdopterin/thiamine biosynthesis adenylyltransferase
MPKSLKFLAIPANRAGQDFLVLRAAALAQWSRERGLSPRAGMLAVLHAGIFPECFERNFPSLSAAEQLRLWQSSVLVAGLGGLGGYLAELLARVGVGRLLLADGDHFLPANLNRQLLATQATLGEHKARVAARRLAEINPALLAEPIAAFLHRDSLRTYLPQVQAAADGLDTLQARRQLVDACWERGRPLVHGAVVGKFGQVTTLIPGDEASLRSFARVLAAEPEASREVLAPTVAIVAGLQVQEIIRLLLGQPPAYRGILAHLDGDTGCLELLPLA